MNNIVLGVVLVEIISLVIAYVGSWFIGVANREDKQLKNTRKLFFIIFFISMNLIIFLE